jgi:hypothetical protein
MWVEKTVRVRDEAHLTVMASKLADDTTSGDIPIEKLAITST